MMGIIKAFVLLGFASVIYADDGGPTCAGDEQYACGSGDCVATGQLCDWRPDCPDASDEEENICSLYPVRCNFESGLLCDDLIEDIDDDIDWKIARAINMKPGSPATDHTTYTSDGYYLELAGDQFSTNVNYQRGRIHTLPLRGGPSACQLQFWYYMSGSGTTNMTIYRRTNYTEDGLIEIATISDSVGHVWLKQVVQLNDSELIIYQIVIEGVVAVTQRGHIALDDLALTPECAVSLHQDLSGQDNIEASSFFCPGDMLPCDTAYQCYHPTERCNFHQDCNDGVDERECTKSCNFEEDGEWCGWIQSPEYSKWERGAFPASPPGPEYDHKNGTSSHDIYFAADQASGNEIAVLQSSLFSSAGADCTLVFWHYLQKDNNGSSALFVDVKAPKYNEGFEIAWVSQDVTTSWVKSYARIGGQRDFIVFFKAELGKGESHIAVDDVSFEKCEPTAGECFLESDFTCADGSCVPRQLRCDASYDCPDKSDEYSCVSGPGDCEFDSPTWGDTCKWMQRVDDDGGSWLQASSALPGTGPSADHTLQSIGKYVYASGDNDTANTTVTQVMPEQMFANSTGICYLRLWYYIFSNYTDNAGMLRGYKEAADGEYPREELFSVNNTLKPAWKELILTLDSKANFFVIFEAVLPPSPYSYVALDDVSFTQNCITGVGPPESNTTCESSEKLCNTGECLPAIYFCDCFMDCLDGSDEADCEGSGCTSIATRPVSTTTTRKPTTTTSAELTVPHHSTDHPTAAPTTTKPPACPGTALDCGDDNNTCVPGLLLCDQVTDCSNNLDELTCPESTPCDPGFLFCGDTFMDIPCIRISTLCDGFPACSNFSADESICGECPGDYCINGGTCTLLSTTAPSCRCPAPYYGNRCERSTDTGSSGGGLSATATAAIVLLVLFAIIVAIVVGMYYRYKTRLGETVNKPPSTERHMDNTDDHSAYLGPDLLLHGVDDSVEGEPAVRRNLPGINTNTSTPTTKNLFRGIADKITKSSKSLSQHANFYKNEAYQNDPDATLPGKEDVNSEKTEVLGKVDLGKDDPTILM